MPGIPITIYTEHGGRCPHFTEVKTVDKIPSIDLYGSKIDAVMAVDYDPCLLLDCDTWVCEDLSGLFEIAEGNFDVVLTHTMYDNPRFPFPDVPAAFPYISSGMVIFKRNARTKALLLDWKRRFDEYKVKHAKYRKKKSFSHPDQEIFRVALYHSDVRVMVVPKEYNHTFWTGCTYGTVKVLHIHGMGGEELRKHARQINTNSERPRLFWERKIIK